MYNWITLLYTWNQHDIVNQLYPNKKNVFLNVDLGKSARGERDLQSDSYLT